ncbi:hypothetical protein R77569_04357 [Ralstonia mannitolilytica]|uniref:Uncharacterized protein n=1 Tax=Ralstonia mannitolilytica TaxID=105219 RepID=A0ABN9KFV3_9RALS|nr:hypothetical protein [Ralstonia mannitolilytica]CAJ0893953.1 hypothetical protein R77569_04357 [Ralstonia mannitolilytica]
MPMCSYFGDNQAKQPTGDKALDDLLSEVRETTGMDWRIWWKEYEIRKPLRKPIKARHYSLIVETRAPEFQVINFYRDNTDWSINGSVSKELIYAYLYGLLAGHSIAAAIGESGHE